MALRWQHSWANVMSISSETRCLQSLPLRGVSILLVLGILPL